MDAPVTTQLSQALEARLKEISREAGYHTDLGSSVWRGFWSRAIEAHEHVPLLAIQPDTEGVRDTRIDKGLIQVNRRLVVVVDGLPGGGNPYLAEETLEAALTDIRKALLSEKRDALSTLAVKGTIEVGDAEYALASDSRYALASAPVTINCFEHY